MNPYTYTRRGHNSPPEAKGFLHSLATAKVSTMMAFAIVLLAAGSTAAITPVAVTEMNQGQEYAMGVIHSSKIGGKVLGESTSSPVTTLNLKPKKKSTSKKTITINPHPVGTLVNDNGTIFLMLQNGKLGIPDVSTFKSWDYSFSDAATANSADHNLPVLGIIVPRIPDSAVGQAFTSTSTMLSSAPRVLISIPKMTMPVGMPVRAAAAADPRQNEIFTFNWGDGNSEMATSSDPYYMSVHSYGAAGQYTFTASFTDSKGDLISQNGLITVGTSTSMTNMPMLPGTASGTPPTMPGSGSALNVQLYTPSGGAVGDQITVGAGADPRPKGATYTFNWGDGSNSIAQVGSYVATHSYSIAGTYTISVNVSYNNTVLGTASKNLTIVQTGTPAPSIDR